MDPGDHGVGDDGSGRHCHGHESLQAVWSGHWRPWLLSSSALLYLDTPYFCTPMARKPSQRSVRPVLGLTMGDPAGIGPEVIAKALADKALAKLCQPVVIGSRPIMERTIKWLDLPLEVVTFDSSAARD